MLGDVVDALAVEEDGAAVPEALDVVAPAPHVGRHLATPVA
jgi:hypothetical protein